METASVLVGALAALVGVLAGWGLGRRESHRGSDAGVLTQTLDHQARMDELALRLVELAGRNDAERETLEILADPELVQAIKDGEDDIATGRTVPLEELRRQRVR